MIAIPRNGQPPAMPSLMQREDIADHPRPSRERVPDIRNMATITAESSDAKPLRKSQKTALVMLAKRAWEKHLISNPDAAGFERWRTEEARKACGLRISEAAQRHFSLIKSHFANIAGDAGKAFNSALRSGTEKERIAMAVLTKECKAAGLDLSYPAKICAQQFKCSLHDASASRSATAQRRNPTSLRVVICR